MRYQNNFLGKEKEIVLVGNPNVGKSCLFNQFTGIGTIISNYPGTTVEIISGFTNLKHLKNIKITDLPGAYSLIGSSPDESVTRDYIFSKKPGVIINILDTTNLSRHLYLTLQLIENKLPVVIALNFIEEANSDGIIIDSKKLSQILGVPVVEVNCLNGKGVDRLAEICEMVIENKFEFKFYSPQYSKKIEALLSELISFTGNERQDIIRFLEGDSGIWPRIKRKGRIYNIIRSYHLEHSIETEISKDKHVIALSIAKESTKITKKTNKSYLEKLSDITIKPKTGIPILVFVLAFIFFFLFVLGAKFERLIVITFQGYIAPVFQSLINLIPLPIVRRILTHGFITGIEAGLSIAIPYISIFYFIISILEDSGYLPRVAYLLDRVMHKLKLHGNSIIPLILGFGCNVPAILSARVLSSWRERLITITLLCLIPCSAVTAIILGATAKYVGFQFALLIYFIDLIIILSVGYILGRTLPGEHTGLILEMPPLRVPSLKNIIKKTWIRLKDFVYIAFPLLIAGAVVIGLLNDYNLLLYIVKPVSPFFKYVLNLPEQVIITLIFGILRKEMALEMLVVLSGSTNLLEFLTPLQIFVFSLVTSIYIPCIATIAVLLKEVGWKRTVYITLATIVIAVTLGSIVTRLFPILGILS